MIKGFREGNVQPSGYGGNLVRNMVNDIREEKGRQTLSAKIKQIYLMKKIILLRLQEIKQFQVS